MLPCWIDAQLKVCQGCASPGLLVRRAGFQTREYASRISIEDFLSLRENRKRNSRSLHCATPDFLLSLEALASFMGLSLLKAAHAPMQVTPTTSHGYQDRRVANWSGAGS